MEEIWRLVPSRLLSGTHRLGNTGTHVLGCILDSLDNVLVAGAAADIAFETCTNLFFSRVGIVFEQVIRGHNHARRAEAALQPVLLPEAFLDRMETSLRGQPLDGGDFSAIGLNCQYGTCFHRLAVEEDG